MNSQNKHEESLRLVVETATKGLMSEYNPKDYKIPWEFKRVMNKAFEDAALQWCEENKVMFTEKIREALNANVDQLAKDIVNKLILTCVEG